MFSKLWNCLVLYYKLFWSPCSTIIRCKRPPVIISYRTRIAYHFRHLPLVFPRVPVSRNAYWGSNDSSRTSPPRSSSKSFHIYYCNAFAVLCRLPFILGRTLTGKTKLGIKNHSCRKIDFLYSKCVHKHCVVYTNSETRTRIAYHQTIGKERSKRRQKANT